jgi:hypothetical protein
VKDTNSFPELICRYGVTDRIELRFGWNYEVGGAGNDTSGAAVAAEEIPSENRLERESEVAYGMKFLVNRQDHWLPGSIVIVQGFTPTSGMETASRVVATYAFGWRFPNKWKLDAAMRY